MASLFEDTPNPDGRLDPGSPARFPQNRAVGGIPRAYTPAYTHGRGLALAAGQCPGSGGEGALDRRLLEGAAWQE